MTIAKYSIWQALELTMRLAVRANEEVRILASRAQAAAKGDPGERGADGKPGKLPEVRAWSEGVHYEGGVVTHGGATWQALRDTGNRPPHEDWVCLAAMGRSGADGRSLTVRGTYSEEITDYRALDVVALNGVTFVSRRDDPGECPGDGWQLMSMHGRPGKPGDRGLQGLRGERGLPGEPVRGLTVDGDGILTLTNGDGSTVICDLYPLLDRLGRR